jgi:hypothetical protein
LLLVLNFGDTYTLMNSALNNKTNNFPRCNTPLLSIISYILSSPIIQLQIDDLQLSTMILLLGIGGGDGSVPGGVPISSNFSLLRLGLASLQFGDQFVNAVQGILRGLSSGSGGGSA